MSLTLAVTVSNSTPSPGDEVEVTFTIGNTGMSPLDVVKVIVDEGSSVVVVNTELSGVVWEVPAGGAIVCRYKVIVFNNNGSFTNFNLGGSVHASNGESAFDSQAITVS